MKRYKIKENHWFKYICILYILLIIFISTSYSFFNSNLSISVKTGYAKVAAYNYQYTYNLDNSWGSYVYQISTNVTYLGLDNITSWEAYVYVPIDSQVIGCYDASSCTISGNIMTIKSPLDYNKDLTTNSTLYFTVQLQTNSSTYFEQYKVLGMNFFSRSGTTEPVPTQNLDFVSQSLSITGGWNNVTTYQYKVTNNSSSLSLSSWRIPFTFPAGSLLDSCWGGTCSLDTNTGILTVSQPSWPLYLNPGETETVNFFVDTSLPSGYQPLVGSFTGTVASQ